GRQGVAALPVRVPDGGDGQLHLLPDSPRKEPTNGMGLPAGGFHQVFQGGTLRSSQQAQNTSRFAALSRSRNGLRRFGFLRCLAGLSTPSGLTARLRLPPRTAVPWLR